MHVLMLSWEYPPHVVGGLGKHIIDLLPALTYEDVDVSLFTPMLNGGEPDEIVARRTRVARVAPAYADNSDFFAFVSHINQQLVQGVHLLWEKGMRFDIIHNHDWMTAEAAVTLQDELGIPMMTTIHATERGRWQGTLANEHSLHIDTIERGLVSNAQRVVVCSHYMAEQVVSYFSAPTSKIDVVPNAVYVRPGPFAHHGERQAFRRRFAADNEHLAFFIGRLVYEKGVHILLDAWAQVLQHVPGRLVIAGVGPNSDDYLAQVDALGLNGRVVFTGQISDEDRERLYHTADVAVFPSIYEPFGIVALEAMAAHCPVVVTQTGGLQEIVRPHETGIVVAPNHVDALVWGMLHTFQHPKWARARAQNALHDLEHIYSWRHVAHEKVAIYHRTWGLWQHHSAHADTAEFSDPLLVEI